MKGCPHCDRFKKILEDNNIEYFDRDIHENEEEYNIFTEITDNEFVPALLIIEGNEEDYESFLYAPDRDYDELGQALQIIEDHRRKLGIIN